MADQKRLPSEVLVVEQARIAAALAIREEIARLEKLAAGLVVSARSNLTAEFGDVVTQVICDKIVDVFAESGLPENCIAAIPGLAEQLDVAHAATSDPTSIALDTSLITGAWLSAFQTNGEPDPDDHPPHDFYGLILNGRNAIIGHQIVEEARTAAKAGSDGKKHPYSRLFGRHGWKKDVYQAAFNEELGLPIVPVVAAPGTAQALRSKAGTRIAPDLPALEPGPKVFPDPPIDGEVGISANDEPQPEPTSAVTRPSIPVEHGDRGPLNSPPHATVDAEASQQRQAEAPISEAAFSNEPLTEPEMASDLGHEPDPPPDLQDDDASAVDPSSSAEPEPVAVEPEPVEQTAPAPDVPIVETQPVRAAATATSRPPLKERMPGAALKPQHVEEAPAAAVGAITDDEDMTFGDTDDLGAPPLQASQPETENLAVVANPDPEPDLTGFLPSFLSDQDDGPPAMSVTSRNLRPPPPPPGRRPMRVAPGL